MAKDQSNEVREINSQTVVGQTVIKANEDQIIACDGKRVSLFFLISTPEKKFLSIVTPLSLLTILCNCT